MNNILEKHITNTQKRFKKYFAMILKGRYNREIADEFIQSYIEARYYNFGIDSESRVFYRKIYDSIKAKGNELKTKFPDKVEIVNYTQELFQYFFYFDDVRNNVEVKDVIDAIADKRIAKYNLRKPDTENFVKEFTKLVMEDIKYSKEEKELYTSKDFDLSFKKLENDYFRVKLNYYFDFPKIFSQEVIETTFETDIVAEDRLFVEYSMVAQEVLKEVLAGNFHKIFIVDFAVSLFNKKTKLDQILTIIENQAAQDKIYLEIKYEDFVNNKNDVYKLIKRGFNFALLTNDSLQVLTNEELKITEIFGCILADSNDSNKNKYINDKIIEV